MSHIAAVYRFVEEPYALVQAEENEDETEVRIDVLDERFTDEIVIRTVRR